jgi:hypothetical protein
MNNEPYFLSETTADIDHSPPPGQAAMMLAGLLLGLLLMGLQLWLLTIALDLYLSGRSDGTWQLALISGLIFLGGIFVMRVLVPQRGQHPVPSVS